MAKAVTILKRIVFGGIMAAIVAGALVLDFRWRLGEGEGDVHGHVLGLGMLALAVCGFFEIRRLARSAGVGLLTISGVLAVAVLGTLPVWKQAFPMAFYLAGDVLFIPAALLAPVFLEQMIRHQVEGAFARVAATTLAVMYLGFGTAMMLVIRLQLGMAHFILFLVAVKCADIGAYFTGTAIGKHKLIPRISPGKTWEGLVGGLALAAGASMLAVWLFRPYQALEIGLSLWRAAIFGVVVGLFGQFGDLCESLLKRSARVKDSGAIVPEFGGVLDLIDSPLLAAPAAYLLLELLT